MLLGPITRSATRSSHSGTTPSAARCQRQSRSRVTIARAGLADTERERGVVHCLVALKWRTKMRPIKTALLAALFITTAGSSFAQTAGTGNGSSVGAVNDGGSQAGPSHHRHHHSSWLGRLCFAASRPSAPKRPLTVRKSYELCEKDGIGGCAGVRYPPYCTDTSRRGRGCVPGGTGCVNDGLIVPPSDDATKRGVRPRDRAGTIPGGGGKQGCCPTVAPRHAIR